MITFIRKAYNKLLALVKSRSNYKFLINQYIDLDDFDNFRKVLNTKRFTTQLKPIQMNGVKANKIVVIAPHPDDDILGAGGTLLKAKSLGAEVHIIYVTNGDPIRSENIKKETLEVCEKAVFTPYFLNFEPKKINVHDDKVIKNISNIINKINPGAIFISFFLDNHVDHRAVNYLLYNYFASNRSKKNVEIWSYQIYSSILPNVIIDITDLISKKKKLINIWKSVSMFNDLSHYILGINATNSIYLKNSKKRLYGEAFFVLPVAEYMTLLEKYFDIKN